MKDKLYIVIPAYNEEANIGNIIRQWHPLVVKTGNDSRLLVINDGSTDRTYNILQSSIKDYQQLIPVSKQNSGHGPACMFGYWYAVQEKADYIFQTDSDGQTNPEEFWQFWENRKSFDFIIGERNSRQDGILRLFVSNVLRSMIWLLLGTSVKDANTPFRLMKTEKLIPVLRVIPDDFFLCNVAISAIAAKSKARIKWIPITFKPRQGGQNTMNLRKIITVGIRAFGEFRKIRKDFTLNFK